MQRITAFLIFIAVLAGIAFFVPNPSDSNRDTVALSSDLASETASAPSDREVSGASTDSHRSQRYAENGDTMLAETSDRSRRQLETIRLNYPGAYEFSSAKQLEWLLSHGFPSTETWMEYSELKNSILLERAKAGDLAAAIVALDRYLNDIEAHTKVTGVVDAGRSELVSEVGFLEQSVARRCTPFYGYMASRMASVRYPGESQLTLIGLAFAGSLGDTRAIEIFRRRVQEAGLEPSTSALIQYSVAQMKNALPAECTYLPLPGN